MSFLADTNVLVDVALRRQPWGADAKRLLDEAFARKISVFVAASAIPTLFYLVEKYSDTATAFAAVDSILFDAVIVDVGRPIIGY